MWRLEDDPVLSSTFANVTVLDRAPDRDRLRDRLWRASRLVPRLRRRVADGPLGNSPRWEDDPCFDIDRHLLFRSLPAGATEADVHRIAVELVATPFDRDRPLWEFTVLDGLPEGRAAMVQKMHHTITDGVGGIRMSVEFIDLERDAPAPPPVDDGPPPGPTSTDDVAPELWRSALGAVTTAARDGIDSAGNLVTSLNDLVRDPGALADALAGLPTEAAATIRSASRQLAVLDGQRSPIWTERSSERSFAAFDVPFDDVREASRRLGVSINDLFVAACAGGAGHVHRALGLDVDDLRISMPVSTRTDHAAAGNAFTPTRVLVPTDSDPRRRLDLTHERLSATKSEKAMPLTSVAARAANLLPRSLLIRLFRQQVSTVDFAASNVRAAPFDLYIGGALLLSNTPVGPLGGTAWNITTMSYRGSLYMGLHADAAAVDDVDALAGAVCDAFEELLALDGRR